MAEVSLRERRQLLLDQPGLGGTEFCHRYAAEADVWLSALADRAAGTNPRHLALLAVGGYGRGELCPYSDLDVVLVHQGRPDVAKVADAIWYPVWDQGVRLDHSVRRPREVLEAAGEDLRVALGLLDARLVWGDPRVADPLLAQVVETWRGRTGARWLPALAEQMAERHRTQGDVAFLLEPDLKESHGGLRDGNVLRAVAAYAPAVAEYVDLGALDPAAALLTGVRVELHRSAGRGLDRLVLQEQDHIAGELGYGDADLLMAAVSEAGRAVAWISDDAWRRRRFWQPALPRRRFLGRGSGDGPAEPAGDGASTADGEVEAGIAVVGGEVAAAAAAPVAEDPSLPLRIAAVAAERRLPIARQTLHRLAEKSPSPADPWSHSTRRALVRVLGAGHPAIEALEALDQAGLMTRLLPEWGAVRNRPQRNAYHRFTVDRHLLEAAANAATLTDRVERPDLLLVGALLHDLGKGFPGDHTEVGVSLVPVVATRMGFPAADVQTLTVMVRQHLLLPETATRRDLDDPATVEAVAVAVGDPVTLDLLAALTEADSLATGPAAWGTWKAGLVAELRTRVAAYLRGDGAPTGNGRLTDAHRQLMAEVRRSGRPCVSVQEPQVVVAAPDRPGLLSAVAGTLALHGLDVRSADAFVEGDVAVELFVVEVPRGTWPDGARLRRDLDDVLLGTVVLDERLAAKARAYARSRRPARARPLVPAVTVDNEASASATVLEVHALDELGLLHRVSRALFECGLDVAAARVSTSGSEVVDAFYVRRGAGTKVTDPTALAELEATVRRAIA